LRSFDVPRSAAHRNRSLGDDEHVDVRDPARAEAPLVEILPVLVEHLHTAVAAIVDEHATRLRIDRDPWTLLK
jgi:hypothetical protein